MGKIEIKDLTVEYVEKKNKFKALDNVTFTVEDGEFVSIIGASGCGKSTLLSILEGVQAREQTEVLYSSTILFFHG